MVSRDEDERRVERIHQSGQVVGRQIAAGQDEIGDTAGGHSGGEAVVDLIGHSEHPDTHLTSRRDVNAALPQCRLGPVDVGLPGPVTPRWRTDIELCAGGAQRVQVSPANGS